MKTTKTASQKTRRKLLLLKTAVYEKANKQNKIIEY